MITGKLVKTRFLLPDPDYNVVTQVCRDQNITRDEFYDTYAWNGVEWVTCIDNEIEFPEVPVFERSAVMVTKIDYAGRSVWVHYRDIFSSGKFCLTLPYQQELLNKMGELREGNIYYVTFEQYNGYTNLVDVTPIKEGA